MDIEKIRIRYVQERRSLEIPGSVCEDLGTCVRYTPEHPEDHGFVQFTSIPQKKLEDLIRQTIDHFSRHCREFEWKTYSFDSPECLKRILTDMGFSPGEEESLLACSTDSPNPPESGNPAVGDFKIVKLESRDELNDILALQEMIYQQDFGWIRNNLERNFDQMDFFKIAQNGQAIASGWIEFPPGSQFAEIHGGAVHPDFRGKGLYSIIHQVRLKAARERGCPYVCADAGPMSYPILRKKGFLRVASTTPFTYRFN